MTSASVQLNDFWSSHPFGTSVGDLQRRQADQENLLILFRKLREGLLSSKRNDQFALEVYETSLHLSIIFNSPKQTSSILAHLLHLYTLSSPASASTHPALPTTLLSLLHLLVTGYPSQSHYYEHLHSLPPIFLPQSSDAFRWLKNLVRCLRTRNYARLEDLTERRNFARFVSEESKSETEAKLQVGPDHRANDRSRKTAATAHSGAPSNLPLEALCMLVEGLRNKARETTWLVLRSAYRELHCPPDPAPSSGQDETKTSVHSPTSEWLARSLTLRPVLSEDQGVANVAKLVDEWLTRKCTEGEVRRKEGPGMEGRWIICKIPVK